MPISDKDLENVRAYAREQAAEAAAMKTRVKFLEREQKRLQKQLSEVHSSWTWRVGRVVLFPIHIAQWVMAQLRQRGK
jgi:hypothetical protein